MLLVLLTPVRSNGNGKDRYANSQRYPIGSTLFAMESKTFSIYQNMTGAVLDPSGSGLYMINSTQLEKMRSIIVRTLSGVCILGSLVV